MKPAPHISMMPPLPFKPYGRRPLRELPFSLQERWLAELSRRLRGADEDDPEGDFALDAYRHGPHASMSFLLPRVADPAVQDTRAKNFAFHLKVLKHFVPEPFTHVPEVVSPLPFQSSQIESRN
jgi:hypothetical protein